MSAKRKPAEKVHKHSAPKWVVGFSSLTTILMTFFITFTVNMGNRRDLGYVGPGRLGAFQKGFMSHGLPSILSGARRVINLVFSGNKYLPEGQPEDADQSMSYDGRLITPPDKDLKNTVTNLLKTQPEVVLPVVIPYAKTLDKESKARLGAVARLVRQNDCNVMVAATLVGNADNIQTLWYEASEWALQIGTYLCREQGIAPKRVMAVGQARPADDHGWQTGVTIVLRPSDRARQALPADAESRSAMPLHKRPETEYRFAK